MTRTNTRSSEIRETETREETDYTFEEPNATFIPDEVTNRFNMEQLSLGWLRIDHGGKEDYMNIGKKLNEGLGIC